MDQFGHMAYLRPVNRRQTHPLKPETMTQHPFIDIAVMDHVREALVAGEAVLVLSADLETVVFANAGGLRLLGATDLDSALGSPAGLSTLQMRQLRALHGFPAFPAPRMAILRFVPVPGQAVALTARTLDLGSGEQGILLHGKVAGLSADPAATADMLGSGACHAAILDADGRIVSASKGFGGLELGRAQLMAMVRDVRHEADRLVKRPLETMLGTLPAALARLRDEDPLHLLLVIGPDSDAPEADEDAPAASMVEMQGFLPSADQQPIPLAVTDAEPVAMVDNGFAERALARNADDGDDTEDTNESSEARDLATAGSELTSAVVSNAVVLATETADALPASSEPMPLHPGGILRFVWKTDPDGRFSEISPAFAEAVGAGEDGIIGRTFADLADHLGMDADHTIRALFQRRDTWSGRTVHWPLPGLGKAVPVELAGLPTFTRDRNFSGFRGFGTARFDELVEHQTDEATIQADVAVAEPDTLPASGNVVSFGRRQSSEPVERPVAEAQGLTPSEAQAFRQIGQRLTETDIGEPTEPDGTGEPDISEALPDDAVQLFDDSEARLNDLADAMDQRPTRFDDEPADEVADPEERPETALPELQDNLEDATALDPQDSAFDMARPETDDVEPVVSAEADGESEADAPTEPRNALEDLRDFAVVDGKAFDELAAPILIHAGDSLHYANPAFLALSGYESLPAIIEAGGLDALFADPDEDEGQPGVMLHQADGNKQPVDAHLKSIRWQGGHALLLVLNPITRHGETDADTEQAAHEPGVYFAGPDLPATDQDPTLEPEAMLAVRDARLKIDELNAILDTATDGVVVMDSSGHIRSMNASAEALFGHDEAELTGKPFTALLAIESHKKAEDYLAALDGNGVASVLNDGREMIGRERHGRFIPLFVTMGRLAHSSGYCAVLRDLTHWKQTEDALNTAKREAEAASSQKTQFLARISHEIRTPLNAIIGFSDLMLSEKFGALGSPRYRDYLFDIHKSGNLVLQLVNDLLDIAKIEAGEEVMTFEAVSLEQIVGEAVSLLQPEANRQRVLVRSSFAPEAPQVVADARSIKQITLNLLSNAVRYTDSGGQVIVSTVYDAQTGEHALRIRDTGIGMTPGEIEEALKPYRQVQRPGEKRMGTGLGLPLTKAMTEANFARFKISSTPGVGTIIEIAFPPSRVLAG